MRGLQIEGHAGLAQAGQDVVCAAVSVLADNLAASLRELARVRPDLRLEKGFYRLELDLPAQTYDTDLLFASALLGLKAIAREYPGRVLIEEEI